MDKHVYSQLEELHYEPKHYGSVIETLLQGRFGRSRLRIPPLHLLNSIICLDNVLHTWSWTLISSNALPIMVSQARALMA